MLHVLSPNAFGFRVDGVVVGVVRHLDQGIEKPRSYSLEPLSV